LLLNSLLVCPLQSTINHPGALDQAHLTGLIVIIIRATWSIIYNILVEPLDGLPDNCVDLLGQLV
jgi:hypothetical protein